MGKGGTVLIWGLTQQEIQQAAGRSCTRIKGGGGSDHGTPRKVGRAFSCTLATTRRPPKWGRRSKHVQNKDGQYRRIPGAVCWHGHREFMRQCFQVNPEARIKSQLADYRGSNDFEFRHRKTFGKPYSHHGARPVGQACDCHEDANGVSTLPPPPPPSPRTVMDRLVEGAGGHTTFRFVEEVQYSNGDTMQFNDLVMGLAID